MSEETSLQFRIRGQLKMQCSGCEHTAEFVVSELGGVQSVTADHTTQRIKVTADTDVSQRVQDALASLGYQVDVVGGG